MKTSSETLAEFAAGLAFRDIPPSVVNQAKLLILDLLGIALASTTLTYSSMVAQMVRRWGGVAESTVLGFDDKVPALNAALVNGSLAHGLDFDDTHTASITHVSSCAVPPTLAVAEAVQANGQAMITAAVVAYETITRIGNAAPGQFHHRGYHATPLCGAFGATLGAGKLYNLESNALVNALGIVGSQAAGLQQFLHDGSWVKRLHPGWAAHSGIAAAELAERGFTGPRGVLEGDFGLFATHVGREGFDAALLTQGLGETWETIHISLKPYPCCHLNHAFMDAARYLRKDSQFSLEDIESIECLTPPNLVPIVCEPLAVKATPPNTYAALFSLPYCVAVVLLEGKAGLDEFSEEKIQDPKVLETARKVSYTVEHESQFPRYFPGWVKIRLKNGKVLERREPVNRGHPENPMSVAEIKAKFRENARRALSPDKVEALAEKIDQLDNLSQISDLMELCK